MRDRTRVVVLTVAVLAATLALLLGYAAVLAPGTATASTPTDRFASTVDERADVGQPVIVREDVPGDVYYTVATAHPNECGDWTDVLLVAAGERPDAPVFAEATVNGTAVYAADTTCGVATS
jgi:hypothetical protein